MEMGQKVVWTGLHKLRCSELVVVRGGIEKCSPRSSYCLTKSYSAFTVSRTQDIQIAGNQELRVSNQKNLEPLSQGHIIWRFMNLEWKKYISLFH